jgi:glc operon protein GlcG
MLSLLKARKIVDRAIQRAQELDVNVSVAVCDNTGRLVALNQMDRSRGWESDRCSMGKAVAAAVTGRSSDRLIEHMQRFGMKLTSCSNVVPPRGQRGGLPIIEGGVVQGGCGVSGAATAEQDEECAMAGIAVLDEARTEPPTPPVYVEGLGSAVSMDNSTFELS